MEERERRLTREVGACLLGAVAGIISLGLIGLGVGFIKKSLTPPPECSCRSSGQFFNFCGIGCGLAHSFYEAIPPLIGLLLGGLAGLILGIPAGLAWIGPKFGLKGKKILAFLGSLLATALIFGLGTLIVIVTGSTVELTYTGAILLGGLGAISIPLIITGAIIGYHRGH